MRKFQYNEYDGVEGFLATITEEEIRREYYPYWYRMMCLKFGKEVVDAECTFEDCIKDFCTVHWAWELTNGNP